MTLALDYRCRMVWFSRILPGGRSNEPSKANADLRPVATAATGFLFLYRLFPVFVESPESSASLSCSATGFFPGNGFFLSLLESSQWIGGICLSLSNELLSMELAGRAHLDAVSVVPLP